MRILNHHTRYTMSRYVQSYHVASRQDYYQESWGEAGVPWGHLRQNRSDRKQVWARVSAYKANLNTFVERPRPPQKKWRGFPERTGTLWPTKDITKPQNAMLWKYHQRGPVSLKSASLKILRASTHLDQGVVGFKRSSLHFSVDFPLVLMSKKSWASGDFED